MDVCSLFIASSHSAFSGLRNTSCPVWRESQWWAYIGFAHQLRHLFIDISCCRWMCLHTGSIHTHRPSTLTQHLTKTRQWIPGRLNVTQIDAPAEDQMLAKWWLDMKSTALWAVYFLFCLPLFLGGLTNIMFGQAVSIR
ncbi:unnamed protein product [Vitrella brassicaformis CCMP3155]|uniref:Uncharacterized protein n=1 Tax=Vitrella brassicaformis (strain CCMP3155) TaxID=1169540 RepID=A0A0G4FWR9_VITBC|nr:unnamed protein product [Vitrella brassicaformis CCMP3155]|eukprot:CEM19380.1 unnamed protein product [Vitrella brassicaformis CCMP3155]